MFLAVVTNQEIMDVLQSLNSKSFWEIVLTVITPVAASIITLWISNKYSEKQLKIQMDNERQRIKDDRNLQLRIEEKKYIDQKTIESLTEIVDILPNMFQNELIPDILAVYNYYKALEGGWDNIDHYRSTALSGIKKSGTRERKQQLKCNILMAYAKEKTREEYETFVKDILWFSTLQLYYQYDVINGKKSSDSDNSISKSDFIKAKERYDTAIVKLVGMIQDELALYIDDLRNMK